MAIFWSLPFQTLDASTAFPKFNLLKMKSQITIKDRTLGKQGSGPWVLFCLEF